MSLNTTTRVVTASSAEPQRERGERREGAGADGPGNFQPVSHGVPCGSSALGMRRTRADTAQSRVEGRASSTGLGWFDYRPDDTVLRHIFMCGSACYQIAGRLAGHPSRARQAFEKPRYTGTAITIVATRLGRMGIGRHTSAIVCCCWGRPDPKCHRQCYDHDHRVRWHGVPRPTARAAPRRRGDECARRCPTSRPGAERPARGGIQPDHNGSVPTCATKRRSQRLSLEPTPSSTRSRPMSRRAG